MSEAELDKSVETMKKVAHSAYLKGWAAFQKRMLEEVEKKFDNYSQNNVKDKLIHLIKNLKTE